MHRLGVNGRSVLFECGLHQGKRKEAFERNRRLPVDPEAVQAVVLSHAHIDHSGNLPTLVRRGYGGSIYATPATIDLCDIMLRDSAYLQSRDVEYVNRRRVRQGKRPFEPLYGPEDVDRVMGQFVPVDYETARAVTDGVTITFHDAGHILGSAVVEIEAREDGTQRRLLFTGDLGRTDMPILRDPVAVEGVDTLITESTYGNRLHPPHRDVAAMLRDLVNRICTRRSKLIIPAFSVGRTQQIVYFLDELHNDDEIPELPVFVDSPLSTKATEVYERHPECYDREAYERLVNGETPFAFRRLRYITETKDSKALNGQKGPAVIISASGMCEGGRILHHLKNNIEDARNVVLFVGYQAEHTLGRYLLEGHRRIKVFGETYTVAAEIETINALSAHADRNELLGYAKRHLPTVRRAFVVHGEPEQAEALAQGLRDLRVADVTVPAPGDTATL